MKLIRILTLIIAGHLLASCDQFLDEPVYSQLAPENLLSSEEGIRNVLYSAYAEAANMAGANSKTELAMEEWPTDIMWQTGGGENATAVPFINYSLDPGIGILYSTLWAPYYRAIRNANILLDNIDLINSPKKELFRAEARFIRAVAYIRLYTSFGPVPIRRSDNDPVQVPRPSKEEIEQFIENELVESSASLPGPGSEEAYGRAHKGAAFGYLCKFYLNTKQWQKAADAAQKVTDTGYYSLHESYFDLFRVENERNREFIWVKPAFPSADRATSNDWMNGAFPVGFKKHEKTGLEFRSNWVIFASEFRLRDKFYLSFEANDKRKDLIITEFINGSGQTVRLLGNDNTRSFKYWPDPNAVAQAHGNDIPALRYSDILLSRAEALCELNGPNQESIDLVNRVRARAGLENLSLSDFPDAESLRAHLLKERGWEFYSEGKRREDMIRMGKLIADANQRGISNAQPFRELFPIPQQAIDSDSQLDQNTGY